MKLGYSIGHKIVLLSTLVVLILALLQSVIPIGVNSGRISDLQEAEAAIQNLVSQIGKAPGEQKLQEELKKLIEQRDLFRTRINSGDSTFYGTPTVECLLPVRAPCFLKNSSEHNNLFIAVASGVLGACLFILVQIRRRPSDHGQDFQKIDGFDSTCLLFTGALIGLLMLYLLRGTKGALSSPMSGLIQVENPYGIAFASTFGGLFSDRILLYLTALFDRTIGKRPDKPTSDSR